MLFDLLSCKISRPLCPDQLAAGLEKLCSGQMSWGRQVLPPAAYVQAQSWFPEVRKKGKWTSEENKIFERALAIHDRETPDRWIRVAEQIPGKSVDEVRMHYRELVEDVSDIEAGLVPIPGYSSPVFTLEWAKRPGGGGRGGRQLEHERKKGVPWSEEEHRKFLIGLKKCGRGDWKTISRDFVLTRNPTQVASHAQKYFLRLSSGGKDKRRSSIHDITIASVPDDENPPSPSDLPSLSVRSRSVVPPETPRKFTVAIDQNHLKEAPILSTMAAPQANGRPFLSRPPYGEKISNLHGTIVRHQNAHFQMQPTYCRPHV